jgi:hypothetical protein
MSVWLRRLPGLESGCEFLRTDICVCLVSVFRVAQLTTCGGHRTMMGKNVCKLAHMTPQRCTNAATRIRTTLAALARQLRVCFPH